MTQDEVDDVPVAARRFVAVLLTLLCVPALIGFDAWPLTAWRLFSLSRDETQTRWTLDASSAAGAEREVSLEELPLRFRNAEWILAELPGMSPGDRLEVCEAFVEPVSSLVDGVRGVTIVRERQRLDEVDSEWVVTEEREPFASWRGGAVTRVRRVLDDILFGPETGARLAMVHTGLAALLAVRIAVGPYRRLGGLDDALFDPVPALAWLPSMPSSAVIIALQAVGTVAALAAVLRRRPQLMFAIAWACYLVLAGIRGSRGKVLHNDLMLIWVAAPFLLAPIGAALRDRDARRRAYGWSIRVAITIAALIYFFAGYHKLRRSGIDWVFGDNMRYVMLWGPSVGDQPWDAGAQWIGEHLWAAQFSAAFILGLEITFPVVLFVRRLLPVYALAAVALHLGTWVLLGLDYWAWAISVPLLFVDWPAVLARLRPRSPTVTG